MDLPFLPGHTFADPSKKHHHKTQTLKLSHGYAVSNAAGHGLPSAEEIDAQLAELGSALPNLTYKTTNPRATAAATAPKVLPAHVVYDKKVLSFDAYFKQTVHESPLEHYRVRYVKIYYYLEDDTISVVEPEVPNSGMPQGKLIKRQRLPKDDLGNTWHWKDLNIGNNYTFYGKVFHTTDCDGFTQDFLTRNGLAINPKEDAPADPFTQTRRVVDKPITAYTTPSDYDKYRQFLALDRKVLRFYCVWDDRDVMFGELRPFILHYYLVDDTVEIREVREANSGRDSFPLLLRRQKVPRNPKSVHADFPTIVLELKETELHDLIGPADFAIGQTVHIFGRPFLLFDCDEFTKEFYRRNFDVQEFSPISITGAPAPVPEKEVPPYTGYGTHEDSLQSVVSLVPKPPKRDYLLKLLEFGNTALRFSATLQSSKKEDQGRKFIISYHVAKDTLSIFEPAVRNSGIVSGKFLEAQRVPKAGSDPSNPVFITLDDLFIGAKLNVHGHHFSIDDADDYVLSFMEAHTDMFPAANIETLRQRRKQPHTAVLKIESQ